MVVLRLLTGSNVFLFLPLNGIILLLCCLKLIGFSQWLMEALRVGVCFLIFSFFSAFTTGNAPDRGYPINIGSSIRQ